ncbi:MAG: hypothetical protein PF589_02040 [Gammaproteobacteria bacterium]|jgi:hypothetical protein|nr:hypothetical protein [Gammaproteobacteria bacterium]
MRIRDCLIILLLCGPILSTAAFAESKRIEVYSLSQQYWDTQRGETLGGIVAQLLPNNMGMQYRLMSEIINLNPHAFEDNNPDRMLANVRLWLPNRFARTDSKADSSQTQVESFSWGNIKRPQR